MNRKALMFRIAFELVKYHWAVTPKPLPQLTSDICKYTCAFIPPNKSYKVKDFFSALGTKHCDDGITIGFYDVKGQGYFLFTLTELNNQLTLYGSNMFYIPIATCDLADPNTFEIMSLGISRLYSYNGFNILAYPTSPDDPPVRYAHPQD